jgi:hypothetical protein
MVNPTQAPQQVDMTQAPQQVNPTATPMQAASGGLMSIPVNNMFKAKSYATGGIVAFDEGGPTDDAFRKSEREYRRAEGMLAESPYPPRQIYKLGDQVIQGPRSMEEIMGGLPAVTRTAGARPEDLTPEEAAARQREIQKIAGVSEDPYAEARAYQKGIEERQAEERKGNAMDRLLAQAEAFATADPTKGFGYHAAASSAASRKIEADQRAIREKQDTVNMEFRRNMAKEEDARRRGDATGITTALQKQKEDQAAWEKLQMEYDRLDQQRYTTAGNIRSADVNEAKIPIDIFQAGTGREQAKSSAAQARTAAAQAERNAKHQQFMEDEAVRTRPSAAEKAYERRNTQFEREPFIQGLGKRIHDPMTTPEEAAQLIRDYNRHKRAYFAAELAQFPELKLPLMDETGAAPTPTARTRPAAPGGLSGLITGGGPTPTPNTVPFNSLPK